MAAQRHELERRLSGGTTNVFPSASFGGQMSTEKILSQSAAYDTASINGLTLVEAMGHSFGLGIGELVFNDAVPHLLQWNPNNEVVNGPNIDISVNGRYTIPASNDVELLVVDVVNINLPVGSQTEDVDIAIVLNELFPDITGTEAALGVTRYRCHYITNTSSTVINNIQVFIQFQPLLNTVLRIGLDPAGIGDGIATGVAATPVDELTTPAGVSFSTAPNLASSLAIGQLAAGEAQAVWEELAVGAGTVDPATFIQNRLTYSMELP